MGAQIEIMLPIFDVGDTPTRAAFVDGMSNAVAVPPYTGVFTTAKPHQIGTTTTSPLGTAGAPPAPVTEFGNASDSYALGGRWHLNGAQAVSVGSQVAGGSNNINSAVITNFSPNGGNIGGYSELNGTLDNYFVFVVYEALNNTASISSITDSLGGAYTKRSSNTITINNAKTLDNTHTFNVPFYLDVWYRNSQVASPHTGVSVTINFANPVDSVVACALAFSGTPYPSTMFDADPPYAGSGSVASGGTATPQVTGVNTASTTPLVWCALATLIGDGTGGTSADALGFNAGGGTYDSNDFTDGGFGHAPPYWSGSATNHSGTAGYQVGLNIAFTQVSGQLSAATEAWNTFTAANGGPCGWIVALDALRKP